MDIPIQHEKMFIHQHSENITKQELQPLCEKHFTSEKLQSFLNLFQISASTDLHSQTAIQGERIHSVASQKHDRNQGMMKDDPAAVRSSCA